jgi:nucleotide-binding universal stress UspA family protein
MRSTERPELRLVPPHPDRLPGDRLVPASGFRRVVVAIDGMPQTSQALALAATAIDRSSGQIRLVHVRTWRPLPPQSRGDGIRTPPDAELFTETAEQATRLIDEALLSISRLGADADGIVTQSRRGMVGATIAGVADAWEAELIVLGPRSRRSLGSLLRKRVPDQVLQVASCAVLIGG